MGKNARVPFSAGRIADFVGPEAFARRIARLWLGWKTRENASFARFGWDVPRGRPWARSGRSRAGETSRGTHSCEGRPRRRVSPRAARRAPRRARARARTRQTRRAELPCAAYPRDGIPGAVRLDDDGTARSETRGGERETTSAACKSPKASPEGVTYPASSRVRARGI